jgi:hypothetical protein
MRVVASRLSRLPGLWIDKRLATLKSRLGTVLVWLFNVWGCAALLYAFMRAPRIGLELIVTVLVPLLLITHALLFRLLLEGDDIPAGDGQSAPPY